MSARWLELVNKTFKTIGGLRPGDWESGEAGGRLGEMLLAHLADRPTGEEILAGASQEEPMSMLSQYGPYAGGYAFPGGGGERDPYGGQGLLGPGEEEGVVYSGGFRRRHRRINPLNIRAARRAIRRIKGVRKLLHSIERHLPKMHVRSSHHFPFHRRRR